MSERVLAELELPAVEGRSVPLPADLSPRARALLKADGIERAWEHQAAAWRAIAGGHDVVLATATASGKTLGWLVGVLDACTHPRVLVVFPSKALTADQEARICQYARAYNLRDLVADGDHGGELRSDPDILVTNPAMLHHRIRQWRGWLEGLTHLVIDEAHLATGVHGTRVAWVLRRALRLARNRPQVIACSATLADPEGHLRALVGSTASVEVITASAAPRPPRRVLAVPLTALEDVVPHVAALVREGKQVLVYARSRSRAQVLEAQLHDLAPTVVHHAGQDRASRSSAEAAVRSGQARIVIATTTLITGVDLALDAVVAVDPPATLADLQQLIGRAGRRGQPATIVLAVPARSALRTQIASPAGIRELLATKPRTSLHPASPTIARVHLLLAAAEEPLRPEEPLLADPALAALTQELGREGALRLTRDGLVPTQTPRLGPLIEARPETALVAGGQVLLRLDQATALATHAPGAHLRVRNAWYRVDTVDARTISLTRLREPPKAPYRACSRRFLAVQPEPQRPIESGLPAIRCVVDVTPVVDGITDDVGHTRRFSSPRRYRSRREALLIEGSLPEGALHAILAEAALAGLGERDLEHQRTAHRAMFFDAPGATGAVDVLAQLLAELTERALRRLAHCTCVDGCPACVVRLD